MTQQQTPKDNQQSKNNESTAQKRQAQRPALQERQARRSYEVANLGSGVRIRTCLMKVLYPYYTEGGWPCCIVA